MSKITKDDQVADRVAHYLGECFVFFVQHLDNHEVAAFAFPFATAFLQCNVFEASCLDKAMPIFIHCQKEPLLAAAARRILVLAFAPFAPQLETSQYARSLFIDILKVIDAPVLYVVAASFLADNLPFSGVDRTYDQILELSLTADQLSLAVQLLTAMTRTASSRLADSILHVMTDVSTRHEADIVNCDHLARMYTFAVRRLGVLPSAFGFVSVVARLDPTVAVPREESPRIEKTTEDVRREIAGLIKPHPETVAITKCRDLSDLHGMIDQHNPPKIYPFAAQYEMYLGLSKERWQQTQTPQPGKSSSASTLLHGISNTRSFILASATQNVGMFDVQYELLEPGTVNQTLLDIPAIDNSAWKFVVTPAEFLNLEDDDPS
jgi:hypothetical protein